MTYSKLHTLYLQDVHVYNTCSTCWGLNLELEMIQTQVTHSLLYMLYMQSTYMYIHVYTHVLCTCIIYIYMYVHNIPAGGQGVEGPTQVHFTSTISRSSGMSNKEKLSPWKKSYKTPTLWCTLTSLGGHLFARWWSRRPQKLQQRNFHVRPNVRCVGEGREHAMQAVGMSGGSPVRSRRWCNVGGRRVC